MPTFTVALRSPLAFWARAPEDFAPPIDILKAPPEAAGVEFEGREFVWHPPMEREWEGFGLLRDGPMLAVAISDDADEAAASAAAQRFFSAIAFHYDEAVEDVSYGSSGEPDPYHWAGSRAPQAFAGVRRETAPAAIEVNADPRLRVALAYYREGLNAGSPFYRFLALWNVLTAVFDVEHETVPGSRPPASTPEAQQRDAFIRHVASTAPPGRRAARVTGDVAGYFRDEARNAIAHVRRSRGRELNPDEPAERVRLSDDSTWLRLISRAAIVDAWPDAVRVTRRRSP